jgi:hypothetical protein
MTRTKKSGLHTVPTPPEHPAVAAARKAGTPVILCGLCGDTVPELCDRGMNPGHAIEPASLRTPVVGAKSSYMDVCKNMLWYPAVLANFVGAAVQAYATCFELQMHWLGMLTPHTEGEVSGELETKPPATMAEKEEMEHGIDVAVESFEDEILA